MLRSNVLRAILCVPMVAVILIACGGPTGGGPVGGGPDDDDPGGPSAPHQPTITGLSAAAAARGEAFTISGADFGDTPGSLMIGGVPAVVTEWTATRVEATVPAGTPNGWNEVSLSAPGGVVTRPDFFVGTEFTGEAEELQAFLYLQAPGSAVLLGAQDYDLTTTRVLLVNNLHLYGRGSDSTSLTLDETTTTNSLVVMYAARDSAVGLTDLTMASSALLVASGSMNHLDDFPLAAASFTPESLQDALGNQQTLPQLETPTRGALTPLVFDGVTLSARGLFAVGLFGAIAVELEIRDSVIVTTDPTATFAAMVQGPVHVTGSSLEGPNVTVASQGNELRVADTEIQATSLQVYAQTGLQITDSTLVATDGDIDIVGNILTQYASTLAGGPVTITGSVLRALDADLSDANIRGAISITTSHADLTVTDNPTIRAMSDLEIDFASDILSPTTGTFARNPDVHVGVFMAESPLRSRPARFSVSSEAFIVPVDIEFSDNSIAVVGQVSLATTGPGNLTVANNGAEVGDEALLGRFNIYSDQGDVTFTGNNARVADQMTFTLRSSGEQTLWLADNQVDAWRLDSFISLEGSDSGQIVATGNALKSYNYLFVGNAEEITLTNNTLVTGSTGIHFSGGAMTTVKSLTLEGNEVTYGGNGPSGTRVDGVATASFSGNSFTFEGIPVGAIRALVFDFESPDAEVVVNGNNFSGFARALYVRYLPGAANLTMTVNHNVFDFEVSAPGSAAELVNVTDDIDARYNRWGTNTDVAAVEGAVQYSGTTTGSLLVDPITVP